MTGACPRCATALPERARFCPGCGAPAPTLAAAERRLATVLFAEPK